ncbi:MAG: septal ring lytic transglycosylase RlpA family protein, partial [Pseudomonadota bacterium]
IYLGLSGCAPAKVGYPQPVPGPGKKEPYPLSGQSYVINGQRYYVLASARGFTQEGEASWYGRDFHGRRTSNGESYNMYALTAAHKTLPLDTWVKVTNLENLREVTVRINDRGPFARGRIIDLSYTAAKRLSMADDGTALVRIEALGAAREIKDGDRVRTVLVQPDSYEVGRFTVQVGSFTDKNNAQRLVQRLGREFGPASIQVFDRGDAVFYRVHVAELKTLGQAMELQSRLEKIGFSDCFVVAR